MTTIWESLALAALIIAISLGIGVAQNAGLVSADMGTRAVMVITLVIFAYYGNLVPKAIEPNEQARAARRFAGWALTSTGLVSAGLWIFAPVDIALAASIALVGTAVVVVLSRGAATS